MVEDRDPKLPFFPKGNEVENTMQPQLARAALVGARIFPTSRKGVYRFVDPFGCECHANGLSELEDLLREAESGGDLHVEVDLEDEIE